MTSKTRSIQQGVIVLAMIGLALGTAWVVRSTPQIGTLASNAWSGASVNVGNLQRAAGLGPRQPGLLATLPTENETVRLFHELTRIYYDAEVQNIYASQSSADVSRSAQNVSDDTSSLSGVAFVAYDEELDASFVFARFEGLPQPTDRAVRLWLADGAGGYFQAGLVDFVREGDIVAGYSVFTRPGDVRSLARLIVSYDSLSSLAEPELSVLSLEF